MKRFLLLALIPLMLSSCRSDVNFSQALFEHVPEDPDLLVLVRPDDVTRLVELAASEMNFEEMLQGFQVDAKKIEQYRALVITMLEQLGIPVENVETIGFLWYLEQPVILVSGEFQKPNVETKLTELGFRGDAEGIYDYVYNDLKLRVPADGLMMMARKEILEDLTMIPQENRLWNRPDFKKYRENSPLDNSLFVWSHPPENLLSDFQHRDALGDVSLAMNFRSNFTTRATVRIKDPAKTAALYNIIFGAVTMGKGFMGSDPDIGPVIEGVTVSQDNEEVVINLVVQPDQLLQIKERLKKEFASQDFGTFGKIDSFLDHFK